jgi:hypothetical protein
MLLSIEPSNLLYIIEYLEEDNSELKDRNGRSQSSRSASLANDLREQLDSLHQTKSRQKPQRISA